MNLYQCIAHNKYSNAIDWTQLSFGVNDIHVRIYVPEYVLTIFSEQVFFTENYYMSLFFVKVSEEFWKWNQT